jgi:putative membrane protein
VKTEIEEISTTGNAESGATSGRANKFSFSAIIAILVGTAISAALIIHHNVSFILETLQATGWGFFWIFVIQLSSIALGGFAWRALYRGKPRAFTGLLLMLRWIRESINYLLPVARLGGEMAAVRLLFIRGHDINASIAGIIVDKTMEFFSLFFFALPGIIFLFHTGGNSSIHHWTVSALGILILLLIIFLAAQRWGLLKLADKVVQRLSATWAGAKGANVSGIHDVAWSMYADRPRLGSALFIHVLAWLPGTLQVWVALNFMGFPIGLPEAFLIECLTQIICAAAFIMPAALGAQEAAYMTVGSWFFGLPPEAGLALSLAQRLKDVIFGIAGLLVWQAFEGSRLWTLWRERKI